uniref:Uncharacterized protein n=1 Tax=Anguilla anguilla TaxID=7936 RepID=A0A0E9S3S7_ANGAN
MQYIPALLMQYIPALYMCTIYQLCTGALYTSSVRVQYIPALYRCSTDSGQQGHGRLAAAMCYVAISPQFSY